MQHNWCPLPIPSLLAPAAAPAWTEALAAEALQAKARAAQLQDVGTRIVAERRAMHTTLQQAADPLRQLQLEELAENVAVRERPLETHMLPNQKPYNLKGYMVGCKTGLFGS